MLACPTKQDLQRFLDDSLIPAELRIVSGHIDGCSECQSQLDALLANSDLSSRVDDLREAIVASSIDTAQQPESGNYNTLMLGGSGGMPMIPHLPIQLPMVPGYSVDAEIGRGGMGVVFRAQHKRLNRTVALKMVLATGVADPRVVQRFLFEAEVLARIHHPQVVQVFEVNMYTGPIGVGIPYLALELLDGGTLAEVMKEKNSTEIEAAQLIRGLAQAIHAAHLQGIIHRDLKPSNILRQPNGPFKVSDFGLAKLIMDHDGDFTGSGAIVGTPAYMAPEQAAGEKTIGPPADIYSLGAILFELLAGKPPFHGSEPMSVLMRVIKESAPDIRQFQPKLHRDLAAVVMKCLTKEPGRRYATAEALAEDLTRFIEKRPTRARKHSSTERLWYWAKRNPAVAGLVASLAITMTMGFFSVVALWLIAADTAEEMCLARDQATRNAEIARRESSIAEEQRRLADKQGAYLAFSQAVNWCEAGQLDRGLQGFVRALKLADRIEDMDLARVVRINLAMWEKHVLPKGQLYPHETKHPITRCTASRDGRYALTLDAASQVVVWDLQTAKKLTVVNQPSEKSPQQLLNLDLKVNVWSMQLMNANQWLVTTTSSGDIFIHDITTGKFIKKITVLDGLFSDKNLWNSIAEDEENLWVCGAQGCIRRYNIVTGKVNKTINIAKDSTSIINMRLSKNGQSLWTSSRNSEVVQWDIATGKPIRVFQMPYGWIYDLCLSDDETLVAAVGTCGYAYVWNIESKEVFDTISMSGTYGRSVDFVNNSQILLIGDEDGNLRFWNTESHSQDRLLIRTGLQVTDVDIVPNTNELIYPSIHGLVKVPIQNPNAIVFNDPRQFQFPTRVLEFSPDDSLLLTGSLIGYVIDSKNGEIQTHLPLKAELVAARFFADQKKIVASDRNGVSIYNYEDNHIEAQFSRFGNVSNFPIQPNQAEMQLLMGGRIEYWRNQGKKLESILLVPNIKNQFTGKPNIQLSRDQSKILILNGDKIEFLNTKKNASDIQMKSVIAGEEIHDFVQSPDGKTITLGLRNNIVQTWDLQTYQKLFQNPPRHNASVTSVDIHPNGKFIVSGSRDRTAAFWDAKTGLELGPKIHHPHGVGRVKFSNSGQQVATGSIEGDVQIHNVDFRPTDLDWHTLELRYSQIQGNAWRPEPGVEHSQLHPLIDGSQN